jgi:dTDP-4-dehydrorhamnose reductase
MNTLITSATGFIRTAMCIRLSSENKVVGVDIADESFDNKKIDWGQVDLTDLNSVTAICKKYSPDVVIHCAGIAHQEIGAVDSATYTRVNGDD